MIFCLNGELFKCVNADHWGFASSLMAFEEIWNVYIICLSTDITQKSTVR